MSESFSAAIQDSPERGSSKIPNRFSVFSDLAESGVAERKTFLRHLEKTLAIDLMRNFRSTCSTLCNKLCSTSLFRTTPFKQYIFVLSDGERGHVSFLIRCLHASRRSPSRAFKIFLRGSDFDGELNSLMAFIVKYQTTRSNRVDWPIFLVGKLTRLRLALRES